jgi:hypothetical protein
MFHTHVASVSSKCFILLQTYVTFKCFVFYRYVQRVIGNGPGVEGRVMTSQGQRMGRTTRLGSADEACSFPSWLLGPARTKREERVKGKERRGEVDESGVHVWGGTRRTGIDARAAANGAATFVGRWVGDRSRGHTIAFCDGPCC